jgi:predicted metal-binding membrane protein
MTAGLFLAALRHDRAVVLGSLTLVVLLAWTYLLLGGGVGMEMMDMGGGRRCAETLKLHDERQREDRDRDR